MVLLDVQGGTPGMLTEEMNHPSFRDIVPSSFCHHHCLTLSPQRPSCPVWALFPAPGNHSSLVTSLWRLSFIVWPCLIGCFHACMFLDPSLGSTYLHSFLWRELRSHSSVGRLFSPLATGSIHAIFAQMQFQFLEWNNWSHGNSVFNQTLLQSFWWHDFLVSFCYFFHFSYPSRYKVLFSCFNLYVWWPIILSMFYVLLFLHISYVW